MKPTKLKLKDTVSFIQSAKIREKMKPTKKQLESILVKYKQNPDGATSYREFRKRFYLNSLIGCMLGKWRGMVLGIEPDGYTHS